jgi:23S rRNA pseudouridine1911/1915/1917 synthase
MTTNTVVEQSAQIPASLAGLRLDVALAKLFPEYSRAKLQYWVRAEKVTVDGEVKKTRDKVALGETIVLHAELEQVTQWAAEALDFPIVYEDDDLLVINKPVGLVVHPGAGNRAGTLVNALLHYHPPLDQLPRAGLVHRLDKDTSGLLVIAKTIFAYTHLVRMIQKRKVQREYIALVEGQMIAGGTVDQPIGRHPKLRTKMAVVESGRAAITHYRVLERFRAHTLLKVILETGRTHQIRVHMARIHHVLFADALYGWRLRLPSKANEQLVETLQGFKRQALHAARLGLQHPRTGEMLEWVAPLPQDMETIITCLREDTKEFAK